jgi:hypothetical protein
MWAFCFFFLGDRVPLCTLGWPGTHFISKTGLELTILLSHLPPECRAGITDVPSHLTGAWLIRYPFVNLFHSKVGFLSCGHHLPAEVCM